MENTQYRENSDGVSLGRGSNRYDRGGGPRHDRNSGGRGYDWNRGRYDKNRPYSGNRGGFGCPPNPKYKYSATGYRNQEYEEMNDYSNRSRPHDKHSEDHIRDSSPDRNDRARHKDKQNEDHARDPSPDRSSNVQYTQGAEGGRNESMNWNQSQQQGNSGNSEQVYQQGYDNKYDGKRDYYSQGQGRYGAYGGQQCYNRGNSEQYAHNNHWNQPEFYGNWDGTRQKEFSKDRRPRNRDEKSDIHLSKALSFLLRHGAEKQGYKLKPGGFLYVDEILQKQRNLQDYNLEDIQRIVKSNDKQRFFMEEDKETGKIKIRANQGHSLQVENLDLKPLLSHEEAPVVIHGTYYNSWEKIKLTGLNRMGRNHIHFAAGEPGENGVISGMRSSCEVMIYINLQKALEGGLRFFWSANNVILSPGNEDGVIPPAYFEAAVLRNPRQRLEFDQNVTITRVPVGGESLTQNKNKKKKKKKGKGGDEEKGEGTEKKSKKETNEIDESAIEGAESLFNEEIINVYEENVEKKDEKLKVEEENVQRVVRNMEVTEQKTPDKWDEVAEQKAAPENCEEDEDYEDAVQDQDVDDFQDADDGSDVTEEPIVIEDAQASVSAVEYLTDQEVVAVYCYQSEDTFNKILCAVSDKFYIFDIEKSPDIMSKGKLAEFFNNSQKTWKVFHGLTSRICAIFFEKFEIILDGTQIFDLKVVYDIMKAQGLVNMTELKQTRYDPESVPTSLESRDFIAYLKGYQYLSKLMKSKGCNYKKELFEMVNAKICKEKMKKLKEQRKKELKLLNQAQTKEETPSQRKKNNKK